jgi:hypothetical protein
MKVITLTAALALAITLTLSCSGDDGGGGGNSSSSVSSSSGGSSSSNDVGTSCGKLMSQNLNVNVEGSVCYGNDPANCTKYGRLYDWPTAMNLPAKCNTTLSTSDPDCAIQSKHKGICPSDQHIPSKEELNEYGSYGCLKNQAGGYGNSDGYFHDVGSYGYWWSSSESSSEYSSLSAYNRFMYYRDERATWGYHYKSYLHSVRCVQD